MIYFAFQCHNFQRRAIWMLSSILQQSIWPFDIIVDIACMANNGNPSTEAVAEFFTRNLLDTRLTVIGSKMLFARRGKVRNFQIRHAIKANATHIFFADADNVYPYKFLCHLGLRAISLA